MFFFTYQPILLLLIDFQYNRIVSELKVSEMQTVWQQLVLTALRYPNLSETINGQKKGKNTPSRPLDFQSCVSFDVHPGGIDMFSFIYLHMQFYY